MQRVPSLLQCGHMVLTLSDACVSGMRKLCHNRRKPQEKVNNFASFFISYILQGEERAFIVANQAHFHLLRLGNA